MTRRDVWGVLAAVLLSAAVVWIQHRRFQDPHVVHDRWELPAFDAYVYVAMAEQPSIFTVAPWGYRVLTPALIRLLPGNVVRGFVLHMFLGLALAAALLYLFLRAVGHGMLPSLLAVGAFAISPAVAEVIRYPFLVEPVTVALEIAFLLAVQRGSGIATLALLATLGALSKELSLMLVPLVFFVRLPRDGFVRALGATAAVAAPALLATLLLRLYWAPQIAGPTLNLGAQAIAVVAARLGDSWRETLFGTLLGGLTPVAIFGALTPAARPFLERYAYLLFITLALPLVAWINIGGPRPMAFFGPNTLRLLLFALPGLLSLALFALHRLRPHHVEPPERAPSRPLERLSTVALVACLAAVVFGLDRYRRVDLRGFRDGPLVLTVARESLRTARRLENGRPVEWNPQIRSFQWGVSNPREMDRMRWFLRDGWGERAHYGTGEMVTQEPRASFLIPLLRPQSLLLTLEVAAPTPSTVTVSFNGHPVDRAEIGSDARTVALRVPAAHSFRGDNIVALEAPPGLVVHKITIMSSKEAPEA